ncbi:MAG: tetratricopeptide repeat protein [Saprospiraceae bacterium]
MGRYPDAEASYLEAMNIKEKISGKENADFAAYANGLGAVYQEMGQYAKAEPVFREAMEIRARVLGKENPLYANTINNLGSLYLNMGRYAEAEPLLLEARYIREKMIEKNSFDYARVMHDLGYLYFELGEYYKAKPYLEESVEIVANLLGTSNPNYAIFLNDFADLYMETGNYVKAEYLFLQGRSILYQAVGGNHPDYIMAVFKLANVYLDMGEYAKAEPLYREARDKWAELVGKDHVHYASASNNLALLYKQMGDYNNAEQLYLEAKNIWAKTVGKEQSRYAIAVNNLAILYKQKGDYVKAEDYYMEARDIWTKVLGEEHPYYTDVLSNLALLYMETGFYSKSEHFFVEVKDIRSKLLGKAHPKYAVSLTNLASLYLKKRDYAKAEPLLLEAINILEKAVGKEHPDYVITLNNLAVLYRETNRITHASDAFLELNNIYRHLIKESTTYSSENQMLAYLNFFEEDIAQFHHFTQEYPEPALTKASFDNALFYNGLLLENYSRLFRLAAKADTLVREAFDQWQDYRRSLACEKTKPFAERNTANMAEWENKAETLEKELARTMAGYADLTRQVSWQEVQQKLTPGSAAIEFIYYRYYTGKPTDSTLYTALVLLPTDTAPHFIPLFEEQQLQFLFNRPGFDEQLTVKGLYASNSELLNLLWKPLEPLLHDVKTIYYSPAGLLHRINPAALHDADKQPLSEGRQWVRVGSTRELVTGRLANSSYSQDSAASATAAVWGGIRYNMDSLAFAAANPLDPAAKPLPEFRRKNDMPALLNGQRSAGDESWKPLAGSAREAEQVGELLQKAGFRTEVLSDYTASEERFKAIGQTTPSPRILHVATHGFAYPDPKKESQRNFIEQEPVYKLQDDPMLRSGLILAGANHYWETHRPLQNREDGVLVAYEVRDLNLHNTELAVLSACQTGLGDVVGSEGVYGLQRAFRIAGVRFLIVSLWQVPDEQTRELMRLFYENWLDKRESLRDAFNHAQATLRERESNPYMWAGFVLIE